MKIDYLATNKFHANGKCTQFRITLRKLEIAKLLTNFEIAKLLTNFEIAWPTLCNFDIAQLSLCDFEMLLCKLEIAKLSNIISRVDVYSNKSGSVPFPESKNLHVGSLILNTKM